MKGAQEIQNNQFNINRQCSNAAIMFSVKSYCCQYSMQRSLHFCNLLIYVSYWFSWNSRSSSVKDRKYCVNKAVFIMTKTCLLGIYSLLLVFQFGNAHVFSRFSWFHVLTVCPTLNDYCECCQLCHCLPTEWQIKSKFNCDAISQMIFGTQMFVPVIFVL